MWHCHSFTQSQGLFGFVSIAVFLIAIGLTEKQFKALLGKQAAILGVPLIVIVSRVLGYYASRAGAHGWCTRCGFREGIHNGKVTSNSARQVRSKRESVVAFDTSRATSMTNSARSSESAFRHTSPNSSCQ